MDDTKKTGMETFDQNDQPDMNETGGDVKAMDSNVQEHEGQKGGAAAQQKQEEQSFKEYEEKGKSKDKGNQPSESDDLWGEE